MTSKYEEISIKIARVSAEYVDTVLKARRKMDEDRIEIQSACDHIYGKPTFEKHFYRKTRCLACGHTLVTPLMTLVVDNR